MNFTEAKTKLTDNPNLNQCLFEEKLLGYKDFGIKWIIKLWKKWNQIFFIDCSFNKQSLDFFVNKNWSAQNWFITNWTLENYYEFKEKIEHVFKNIDLTKFWFNKEENYLDDLSSASLEDLFINSGVQDLTNKYTLYTVSSLTQKEKDIIKSIISKKSYRKDSEQDEQTISIILETEAKNVIKFQNYLLYKDKINPADVFTVCDNNLDVIIPEVILWTYETTSYKDRNVWVRKYAQVWLNLKTPDYILEKKFYYIFHNWIIVDDSNTIEEIWNLDYLVEGKAEYKWGQIRQTNYVLRNDWLCYLFTKLTNFAKSSTQKQLIPFQTLIHSSFSNQGVLKDSLTFMNCQKDENTYFVSWKNDKWELLIFNLNSYWWEAFINLWKGKSAKITWFGDVHNSWGWNYNVFYLIEVKRDNNLIDFYGYKDSKKDFKLMIKDVENDANLKRIKEKRLYQSWTEIEDYKIKNFLFNTKGWKVSFKELFDYWIQV